MRYRSSPSIANALMKKKKNTTTATVVTMISVLYSTRFVWTRCSCGAAFVPASRHEWSRFAAVGRDKTITATTSGVMFATSSGTTDSDAASIAVTSGSIRTGTSTVQGIDWLRDVVVQALGENFDPREVARGAALAKLDAKENKKKKTKKNKKSDNEETAEDSTPPPPVLTEEERQAIGEAAAASAPSSFTHADAMVTPATKEEFGDYQCNAAMGLSKSVGLSPRECAARIVEGMLPHIDGVMEDPEIAGPGFINLKFTDAYLSQSVDKMAADAENRLAVAATTHAQRIVVDYSSPNIAKEMHVGHLRSTIIGDTLANVLEFCGHDVVRLNHVGDWGTQFGMLVEHLRDECPSALVMKDNDEQESNVGVDLGDLVEFYKQAKRRFDAEPEFQNRSRQGVVKLQAGDAESLAAWKSLCAASRTEYRKIYNSLNIDPGLTERGESFYNPYLSDVVKDLEDQGIAVESEGAKVVFLDGYTNRDGSPLPMLVQKSDGGFIYATTDLAAVRHRVNEEKADRILYVTDSGQSQHFEMVFETARRAGYAPPSVSLEHVPFGLVQGSDGKKFATRSGDTVKLRDLLDEATRIAGEAYEGTSEDINDLSRVVGIGAVKYADLSLNRESNYRFSYDRMLSLQGNTAPYMLYAYARIGGIVRKAAASSEAATMDHDDSGSGNVNFVDLQHPSEKRLARNLVKLPDLLSEVERDLYPHRICDYLFETSQKFNRFYEDCPVNRADPATTASRLALCRVTASTLRLLMGLLGIETVDRL